MGFYNKDIKRVMIFPELLPLHQKLRAKRLFEGFTLEEASEILDCSPSTLSLVENGKRRIPLKSIEKVKQYLFQDVYIDKQLRKD